MFYKQNYYFSKLSIYRGWKSESTRNKLLYVSFSKKDLSEDLFTCHFVCLRAQVNFILLISVHCPVDHSHERSLPNRQSPTANPRCSYEGQSHICKCPLDRVHKRFLPIHLFETILDPGCSYKGHSHSCKCPLDHMHAGLAKG